MNEQKPSAYLVAELAEIFRKAACNPNIKNPGDINEIFREGAQDYYLFFKGYLKVDDLENKYKHAVEDLQAWQEYAEKYKQAKECLEDSYIEEVKTLRREYEAYIKDLESKHKEANKVPKEITINHNLILNKTERNLLTKLAFLLGPSSNHSLNKWIEE